MEKEKTNAVPDTRWHRHCEEAPQLERYVLVAINHWNEYWSYSVARWMNPNSYNRDGAYNLSDGNSIDFHSNDVYWRYIDEPFSLPVQAQKKYFRYHRGGFDESMKTMVEVNGLDDIRRIVEDDALHKGYFKNIRIGDGFADKRCEPYGWGEMSYYVLADFGNFTGQCIGMANFKEE